MNAAQYKTLRRKIGTQKDVAALLKCSVPAITNRERGVDLVSNTAELAILRAIAEKLVLGQPLTARPKAILSAKRKAAIAKLARNAKGRAAAAKASPALEGFAQRVAKPAPAPAATCSFVDGRTGARCMCPVEALPDARLCPSHGAEAGWLGLRRFK